MGITLGAEVLDRVSFRDFLLENGVSGREDSLQGCKVHPSTGSEHGFCKARNLFFKMARNNEVSSPLPDWG